MQKTLKSKMNPKYQAAMKMLMLLVMLMLYITPGKAQALQNEIEALLFGRFFPMKDVWSSPGLTPEEQWNLEELPSLGSLGINPHECRM